MFHVFNNMTPDLPLSPLEIRWQIGAGKLAVINRRFADPILGLGRVDVCLRKLAPQYFDWIANPANGKPMNGLGDYEWLSASWVIGGYEILRSLAQRLDKSTTQYASATLVKRAFARVRMPLAKFEAATSHSGDQADPDRFGERSLGAGWALNGTTNVYRVELADAFLEMFEEFDHTEVTRAFESWLSKP